MKYSIGQNKKLGNAMVVSRPVGDSCPSSCKFLNNGCYAERTERIYTNTRRFTMDNMITEKNRIYSMLRHAMDKEVILRIGERGDLGKDDAVDKEYVDNLREAFAMLAKKYGYVPKTWLYTHFLDAYIPEQLGEYISVYASVHNEEEAEYARSIGFTNVAYASEVKYKRNAENPKKVDGKQVCPNQINKSITCDDCRWCVDGVGDIVFLKH